MAHSKQREIRLRLRQLARLQWQIEKFCTKKSHNNDDQKYLKEMEVGAWKAAMHFSREGNISCTWGVNCHWGGEFIGASEQVRKFPADREKFGKGKCHTNATALRYQTEAGGQRKKKN